MKNPKAVRIGAVGLVVAVVVAIGAVSLLGGDEGTSSESSPGGALSEAELREQVSGLDHPAYWVGPRPDTEGYELTSSADGRIYIRYLTGGAKVSAAPAADLLAVGTYPVPDAHDALRSVANGSSSELTLTEGDGYEILDGGSGSTNAYVVFDDQPDLQIEIYSPTPGEAAELVASGALVELG